MLMVYHLQLFVFGSEHAGTRLCRLSQASLQLPLYSHLAYMLRVTSL